MIGELLISLGCVPICFFEEHRHRPPDLDFIRGKIRSMSEAIEMVGDVLQVRQ